MIFMNESCTHQPHSVIRVCIVVLLLYVIVVQALSQVSL